MGIDRFGNTSSASIPLAIAGELESDLKVKQKKVAMLGFGVGYSWGGFLGDLGPMESLGILEV